MNTLKGSQRIVFDELRLMLDHGEPISIMRLANRSLYHPITVSRALSQLESCGLVYIRRAGKGRRCQYAVAEDLCYSN
jgi:DNA-binding MarR family transcriptional regulator